MTLPIKLPLDLMQTRWASILNPLLGNPFNGVNILENVILVSGTNIINHGLGRAQQGWVITDVQGSAVIYRNAPFNNTTLSLSASAGVIVNIGVF
jgi:hypothetical protein